MNIIKGNLINLALEGRFNLIAHGCNCQNIMGAGIAKQIKETWPDAFAIDGEYRGQFKDPYNMMGTYSQTIQKLPHDMKWLRILNLYTQLYPGLPSPQSGIPFDYDAFTLCCKKINHHFPGEHLGIPLIGCGLAGGDKEDMISIVKYRIPDLQITIVEYEDNKRTQRPLVSSGLGNASSTGKGNYYGGGTSERNGSMAGNNGYGRTDYGKERGADF